MTFSNSNSNTMKKTKPEIRSTDQQIIKSSDQIILSFVCLAASTWRNSHPCSHVRCVSTHSLGPSRSFLVSIPSASSVFPNSSRRPRLLLLHQHSTARKGKEDLWLPPLSRLSAHNAPFVVELSVFPVTVQQERTRWRHETISLSTLNSINLRPFPLPLPPLHPPH